MKNSRTGLNTSCSPARGRLMRLFFVAALGLQLLSVGCSTLVLQTRPTTETPAASSMDTLKSRNSRQHHEILFGFVPLSRAIHESELCPQGIEQLVIQRNVWSMLLTAVTLGLYSYQQISWTCRSSHFDRSK